MHPASSIERILQEKFGFSSFRADQREIIETALKGESALVLMPTGMGKSLCYQLPAHMLAEGELVLVISPLIALMHDQVQKAREVGIDAVFINSTLTKDDRETRQGQLAKGKFQLLFVTPERFRKEEFWQALASRKIALLAVDEAHCISQWGHDFRPDYSRLGEIRERLGNPPTLALTATATKAVQQDILEQLHMQGARIFSAGIERNNLEVSVHHVVGLDEKVRSLVGLRYAHPGPAIVYFSLIQNLYKISEELAKLQMRHLTYHGQQSASERRYNQDEFLKSSDAVILATPAFGLGVDKRDIRLVVHAEIPGSLEATYQEMGRAGRDGKPSFCHVLYDPDDVSIQMDFLKWANPEGSFILNVYRLIERNPLQVQQEGFDFLRAQMNFYNKRDYRVETAVNLLERWGCLELDKSPFGYKPLREPRPEELDVESQKLRLKTYNEKLLAQVRWAEMEQGCRLQTIYQYFDHESGICGKCDLCLKK